MPQQVSLLHNGETLADRLIHQPSVGEPRLRENRADRRRCIGAIAGTELRQWEIEDHPSVGKAPVARGEGRRIGGSLS